jgi:hypothetical protein
MEDRLLLTATLGPGSLIQSTYGTPAHQGNFEAVLLEGHNLVHYWRDNADTNSQWQRDPFVISTQATGPGTLIESSYGPNHNNFEVVVPEGNTLVHYWRSQPGPWQRDPFVVSTQATGPASLIESSYGPNHDNFEVVVPEGGTLVHYWRSQPGPWQRDPFVVSTQATGPASLIENSNGNFEVVVQEGANLVHYWRSQPGPWNRDPFDVTTAATGAGCLIQNSNGNFEVVVQEGATLVHYWRAQPGPWQRDPYLISNTATSPGVIIQSTFGTPAHMGNFEVLAQEGNNVVHYWRDNGNTNNSWRRAHAVNPQIGFHIDLNVTGLSPTQTTILNEAAARWEQVVVGDLPNAVYAGKTVDDLLIDVSTASIDGPGGVVGRGGPDAFRSGSFLPYHAILVLDTADLATLESSGLLRDVILHEMGHDLGIGTIWAEKGLLTGAGGPDPRFTGAQATAAYDAIFGTTESSVPVENTGGPGTRDAHWRESVLGNELMTSFLNSTNPLSRITAASLIDLGYAVNLNAADPFTRPSSPSRVLQRQPTSAPIVSLPVGGAMNSAAGASNPGESLGTLAALTGTSLHREEPGKATDRVAYAQAEWFSTAMGRTLLPAVSSAGEADPGGPHRLRAPVYLGWGDLFMLGGLAGIPEAIA